MNIMERKELSVVDEDIADVFIDAMDKQDYHPGQPTQIQIARSLKDLNSKLKSIIEIISQDTHNISVMNSESMDQALRRGGATAIRDIAIGASITQGSGDMENRKIHDANPCYDDLKRIEETLSKTSPVAAEGFKKDCDSRTESPYRLLYKLTKKLIRAQGERICLP